MTTEEENSSICFIRTSDKIGMMLQNYKKRVKWEESTTKTSLSWRVKKMQLTFKNDIWMKSSEVFLMS